MPYAKSCLIHLVRMPHEMLLSQRLIRGCNCIWRQSGFAKVGGFSFGTTSCRTTGQWTSAAAAATMAWSPKINAVLVCVCLHGPFLPKF